MHLKTNLVLIELIVSKSCQARNCSLIHWNNNWLFCQRLGTHWLFEVLHMIQTKTLKTADNFKTAAMLECARPGAIDKLPSPRILNTHLYPEYLPTVGFCQVFRRKGRGKTPQILFFYWDNYRVSFIFRKTLIYIFV